MRVTLHQLKVFEVVAEQRSITSAAHKLHMTQPAVSNIIKQLQDYYGCALIEVISRRLYLTEFGQVLLAKCQVIRTTLEETKAELALLKGGLAGTLSVATVSTAKYFVPKLLGEFKQQYSNVHIKLTVCNRQQVIERLEKNSDDFVIMSHPPSALTVDCTDFFADELVVAQSSKQPLSAKPVSLQRLANKPWIVRESGSGTRYATEQIFKQHNVRPSIEMEIGDNEAIKQAVIADIGISVISRQSIAMELASKVLSVVPVQGFPVEHTWYLVKLQSKSLSPIAKTFYDSVSTLV